MKKNNKTVWRFSQTTFDRLKKLKETSPMPKVTEETVAKAANKMRSEGKMPTQTGIRDAIGGGSFTTISQCLGEWRKNNGEQARTVGRPSSIDDQSIAEAAENLIAKGRNPTVASVRAELGRGSYSTIGPLFKAWRERMDAKAKANTVTMPESLRKNMAKLQSRIWQMALEEAQAGHEGMRRAIVQAQAELDAVRAENIEVVNSLKAKVAQRDAQIEALQQQLEARQGLHAV